ncbi:hypothetical protein [Streptomyces sp. NPDC047061]|uniref:hypothetical protein n=1 Tax=Streptomyces sp. NPDC047061 TaxID=3154605 RepID=UPI0033FEAA83
MKTRWRGVSRRRGLLITGVAVALLASGGVAAAASGDDGTTDDPGITLTEVPGAVPTDWTPATLTPVDGATLTEDPGITLTEVPGVKPTDVQPGHATALPHQPVVVGDGGDGVTLPGHTR